jgi:xanthine dehydrogenase YagS FAD-binding subunit
MSGVEWANPTTVAEALASLSRGAVVKAGGIDLADLVKERLVAPFTSGGDPPNPPARPVRLVNLRSVRGLDRIEEDREKNELRIGPLVTMAKLAEEPLVRRRARALAEAAGHAATPQIRNAATVGGNLLQRPRCWYFRQEAFPCRRKGGTTCFAIEGENQYHAIFANGYCAIVHPSAAACALVAHGARLVIAGPQGTREAPLESIFVRPETDVTREHSLAPNEIITEIRVPAPPPGGSSAYTKLGEKESFDWPIAEVAVVLGRAGGKCTSASIVLGAAAPIPWRARAAEDALAGKDLSEDAARAAAKAALTGATPLSQNAYKLQVFEAVVRRTIVAAMTTKEEAR